MEGGTSLPLFPAFLTVPIWDTPYTPKTTFLTLFGVIFDPHTHFTPFWGHFGVNGGYAHPKAIPLTLFTRHHPSHVIHVTT